MQQITEQQIQAMAPNAAAVANAAKISKKGGFVRLERSADDTFYLGECTGSGKSNYITTVDFMEPDKPLCRCSCPSRQFPCKHGLALLYEILAGKSFGICEIPEDIIKKREKKQARDAKAAGGNGAAHASEGQSTEDAEALAKKKASAAKSAKAAKTKKIKKQLEGLELAAKLVQDLMKAGLGTMGGAVLKTYEQMSKQLGDYYLPGPQRLLNGLILEIAAFQKDGDESHYEAAIDILEKLWALIKKSQKYLSDKVDSGEVEQDDSELYEELGGIWKLAELEALGKGRADVDLMQLSFWVVYDEARKEYIDTGYWADLATGEIFAAYNYRPIKALKYVKQEDTVFGVAHIGMAACYPGEGNLRIRWDGAQIRKAEPADLEKLREFASDSLGTEAKNAKNILKNALADPMYVRLISFEKLGRTKDGFVLQTQAGESIVLGDAPGMESTIERLGLLPDKGLLRNQVLLGAFYYDSQERRLKLQPLSIVTQTDVVRLLY
ncbi:MAG: SWIM zinc finger domain-containing protein [Clostridium sp.]|nr:SWIM zinc finger domain-containing protein [Clostridium sp.]